VHIAAYPAHLEKLRKISRQKVLEIGIFTALPHYTTNMDRTQEVGGSNPPSSTDEGPRIVGPSAFRDRRASAAITFYYSH